MLQRLIFGAILLFGLCGCRRDVFEWYEVQRDGTVTMSPTPPGVTSSPMAGEGPVTLLIGECKDLQLLHREDVYMSVADVSEDHVRGVLDAHSGAPTIVSVAHSGRTWKATEAYAGLGFADDREAPIFRVCGLAGGSTSLQIGERGAELGSVPVLVSELVAP